MTLHDEMGTRTPDRFEIVKGDVVPQTPTGDAHSDVEGAVFGLLLEQQKQGLGLARVGEVGVVVVREPLTVRGADAAFLLRAQLPQRLSKEGYLLTPPALVVEVVSPGDRAGEVEEKVGEYLNAGVLVVWVAYPSTRTLHVHQPDGTVRKLKGDDRLWAPNVLDLEAPVSGLFAGLDTFRPAPESQPPA